MKIWLRRVYVFCKPKMYIWKDHRKKLTLCCNCLSKHYENKFDSVCEFVSQFPALINKNHFLPESPTQTILLMSVAVYLAWKLLKNVCTQAYTCILHFQLKRNYLLEK